MHIKVLVAKDVSNSSCTAIIRTGSYVQSSSKDFNYPIMKARQKCYQPSIYWFQIYRIRDELRSECKIQWHALGNGSKKPRYLDHVAVDQQQPGYFYRVQPCVYLRIRSAVPSCLSAALFLFFVPHTHGNSVSLNQMLLGVDHRLRAYRGYLPAIPSFNRRKPKKIWGFFSAVKLIMSPLFRYHDALVQRTIRYWRWSDKWMDRFLTIWC